MCFAFLKKLNDIIDDVTREKRAVSASARDVPISIPVIHQAQLGYLAIDLDGSLLGRPA